MESSDDAGIRPFFTVSHWMWLALTVLLAIVSVGTTGQAVWKLAQRSTSVSGTIVEVSETRISRLSAIYHLVLRTGEGDLSFVQLRNNGRILNYLLTQDEAETVARRVTLEEERGVATEMIFLDGAGLIIREFGIQPAIQLLIGLFPLVILSVLLWSRVSERQ